MNANGGSYYAPTIFAKDKLILKRFRVCTDPGNERSVRHQYNSTGRIWTLRQRIHTNCGGAELTLANPKNRVPSPAIPCHPLPKVPPSPCHPLPSPLPPTPPYPSGMAQVPATPPGRAASAQTSEPGINERSK